LDCSGPTFAGEEADFRGRAEVIAARGECRNFIDRIDILASQLVARWLMFRAAIMRAQHGSSGAFEMLHQLASRGAPLPILLVVSGPGAASLPSTNEPVHATPDLEFCARLRELNATPPEILQIRTCSN
jgi:surfactin synthase thioesterase subunit